MVLRDADSQTKRRPEGSLHLADIHQTRHAISDDPFDERLPWRTATAVGVEP